MNKALRLFAVISGGLMLSATCMAEVYVYAGPGGERLITDHQILNDPNYKLISKRQTTEGVGKIAAGRDPNTTSFNDLGKPSVYTRFNSNNAPLFNAKFTGKNTNAYDDLIRSAGIRHGIDTSLIKAVIRAESNFNPNARSPKGAMGLMQLMPDTAYDMRVFNAFSPRDNIEGGTKYLRKLLDLYRNDVELALAAYNSGPQNVERYGGVPPFPETQNYVRTVSAFYNHFKQQLYAFR